MEVDVMPFVVIIIIVIIICCCCCYLFVVDVPFSEKGTRVPSSAKKHPIWHFCCSRELIFAELGKKAPFSEKGAVITGALIKIRGFVSRLSSLSRHAAPWTHQLRI
jgi:hypothetical protein